MVEKKYTDEDLVAMAAQMLKAAHDDVLSGKPSKWLLNGNSTYQVILDRAKEIDELKRQYRQHALANAVMHAH
jgi:hypothetical protein